jgi:hypothetical protein
MNGGVWRSIRKWADPAGLAAVGLFLAGCGPEAQSPSSEPQAEVRGEPIRGEPITAPATAVAVTPASSNGVPDSPGLEVKSAVSVDVTTKSATPAEPKGSASVGAETSNAAPAVKSETAAPVGQGTAASPLTVSFDKLASFAYALPDGPVDTNVVVQTATTNQIPTTIRALNDQFISLKGFMLPLKVEKGLVTELLIMRDQSMCCYGTVPKINEWVSVKMVGDGVKPVMDQAVTLFGKLKVGEMYENGYLVGIYALDGERMAGPLDL